MGWSRLIEMRLPKITRRDEKERHLYEKAITRNVSIGGWSSPRGMKMKTSVVCLLLILLLR